MAFKDQKKRQNKTNKPKLSAKEKFARFMQPAIWPGLTLQRVTTSEPSDDMLEVAIAALDAGVEVDDEARIAELARSLDAEFSVAEHEVGIHLAGRDVTARLRELTEGQDDIEVKRVGCLGLCAAGPLVEIAETGEMVERVDPENVQPVIDALAKVRPDSTRQQQAPFFERQVRVATENFGNVDRETRDLVVDPPDSLMSRCEQELGERVSPEFLQSQIEVGTSKCDTVGQAGANQRPRSRDARTSRLKYAGARRSSLPVLSRYDEPM